MVFAASLQSMKHAITACRWLAGVNPTPLPAQVLRRASERGELVSVALNTHGTRAVQKLIETLTTREQVRRLDLAAHSCLGACSFSCVRSWRQVEDHLWTRGSFPAWS